jgi:hypothetical protein
MAKATTAVELRAALRRGLIARLAGAGWREVEPGVDAFLVVGLLRPLDDGFAATAEVTTSWTFPDHPPVEVGVPRVGAAYEPLRQWWPLLGDRFGLSLLTTSASRPQGGGDEDRGLLEVSEMHGVPAAVETLASMVLEHAVSYAERYADPEALLAAIGARDDTRVDLRTPALLGALGRFEEAALALDRYEPPPGSGSLARSERRTAYQLRRLVGRRGDPSLMPSEPPPSEYEDRSRRSSFAETGAEVRAKREAVEVVRQSGRGRERDEVRAMLARELARRGVDESPLALEHTLDHLWDTPAERFDSGVQGLKALGRLGVGVAKAIRNRELPDLSTPQWLEPPDPAFYALPRSDHWTLVTLAPGIDDQLERIHQAARPRILGVAPVMAWLQPEPSSDDIAVFIGHDRLGLIPADAVDSYRPIMRSARFREEFPVLAARLTHRTRPPHDLLELTLPPF